MTLKEHVLGWTSTLAVVRRGSTQGPRSVQLRYGFVVFCGVISDDDCELTRREIWSYLERKVCCGSTQLGPKEFDTSNIKQFYDPTIHYYTIVL